LGQRDRKVTKAFKGFKVCRESLGQPELMGAMELMARRY